MVVLISRADPSAFSYYGHPLTVDGGRWKEVVLPFNMFRASSSTALHWVQQVLKNAYFLIYYPVMSKNAEHKHGEGGRLPRFSILDVRLTGVRIERAVEAILDFAADGGRHYVCIFAADSLLRCRDMPKLAQVANASDMTLCDGMPLVFIGRKFAKLDMSRCYGPDVMLKTIEAGCAKGLKHFFYGGDCEATVRKLEGNLRTKYSDIKMVGHYVPPFRDLTQEERADVVSRINESGADFVWVGVGTPRQDYWVGDYRPLLKAPVLLAVGAAFNFHAGTVPQAPRWMMRCGLEWLFRLAAEPQRLWRRYLIGNPRFILLVLRQLLTRRPAPLGDVAGVRGPGLGVTGG